jgi:hypothetical protein
MWNILQRLAGFDADSATPDELIELRALGRVLEQEYKAQAYEVPERVSESLTAIDAEIARKRKDALTKRLRELDAQDLAARTADEKKADRQTERERIKAALGQS